MGEVMETTVGWSLILLVATTCAVMIYFIFLLMHWMGKAKKISIIRKLQAQETKDQEPMEVMEMEPVAIRHGSSVHKVFWIAAGISYFVAIFLIFWYFVFILIVVLLLGKFLWKKA